MQAANISHLPKPGKPWLTMNFVSFSNSCRKWRAKCFTQAPENRNSTHYVGGVRCRWLSLASAGRYILGWSHPPSVSGLVSGLVSAPLLPFDYKSIAELASARGVVAEL